MVILFQILAVILGGIAAFFLWKGDTEVVFVSGVLCACAYLMSLRFRIKARIRRRAEEENEAQAEENIVRE